MQTIKSIMQSTELILPINPFRYVTQAEAPAKSQRPDANAFMNCEMTNRLIRATLMRTHTAATGM